MRRRLAALLTVLSLQASLAAPDGNTLPSVQVSTETPRQGSLARTLTAYGTVRTAPGGSEALSLLRAGQVTRVLVAPGQSVHRGETLLSVSADPAALAAYSQAVGALSLARGERVRTARMLAQHLATNDQLALTDKAVTDAQASLDVLNRAGGGSAGQNLAAPFDGVVSSVSVASGTRVAAQAPLLTLERTSRLVASVGIEPALRAQVVPGQPAEIQPLDGGTPVAGSVLSVSAMLDPATRLVPVLVDPPGAVSADPLAGLLPGGAVRVVVRVGEYRGWLLPRDAVLGDALGAYVFQVDAGRAVRTEVRVVGTVDGTTVVAGKLDPARPLVITGNYQLQDGGAVHEAAVTP